MLEFVEIYWRSNINVNKTEPLAANEFIVIYLCRQFSSLAEDVIETGATFSRLRPNEEEFVIFDQLPKPLKVPQSKKKINAKMH